MTRWTWISYAYAAVVVVAFAYFLFDIPVQVSDSYGNLVQASSGTLGALVSAQFHARAFLRPFLWAHIRIVYDLAGGGHYFEWFRGWHVGQIVALTVLFLRLVQPRTIVDAAAVPVGLAALLGIHTFAGTVREAFPINAYMTIVLCCYLAADLALGRPRWWRDVAAVLLFVFAVLSVESGLLVAVVLVAAFVAGARGVSRRGLATVVALVVGYFALRFIVLDVGTPELTERSSGFGFSTREPDELVAMFGGHAWPFYLYNVATSALSVVLSEPRGGIWVATRGLVHGEPSTSAMVNVAASVLALAVIGSHIWARRQAWRARQFDRADRLIVIFIAVLLANAAISYAYTKDVILSPAGAFFACALTVAMSRFISAVAAAPVRGQVLACVLLLAVSGTWAVRAVAAHIGLRKSAVLTRSEWATVDQWLEREHLVATSPVATALKRQLRDDAIRRYPVRPAVTGEWVERLSDD